MALFGTVHRGDVERCAFESRCPLELVQRTAQSGMKAESFWNLLRFLTA